MTNLLGNSIGGSRINFLDLSREASIDVGVSWPYPDLTADECVITSDFKKELPELKVGDKVVFGANYCTLWAMLAKVYNEMIKAEDAPAQENVFFYDIDYPTFTECTIKAFIETPEGKF